MEWVKVSDRLPELDGEGWSDDVLTYEEGTIDVKRYFLYPGKDFYSWTDACCGREKGKNPSHWMPLPPKPEQE